MAEDRISDDLLSKLTKNSSDITISSLKDKKPSLLPGADKMQRRGEQPIAVIAKNNDDIFKRAAEELAREEKEIAGQSKEDEKSVMQETERDDK
jgi:hypothetical protein